MKHFLTLLLALALTLPAAQAADEAKLQLAHEAVKAMQADKTIDAMMAQMKTMARQMAGNNPNLTADQKAKAEALQGKILEVSMEAAKSMVGKLDEIYADIYSEAELKAMIAFFKSPEGQSMQAKQPQIMQRMMPLVQEMQRGLMPKIQKIVEESKAAAAAPAAPGAPAAPAAAVAPAAK